jgi:REP element-mobilizing transposase RayT
MSFDDIGSFRGHGPLLQVNHPLVGAGHAREQTTPEYNKKPGHRALRRGRVSVPHGVYLVTTTTYQRLPLFADFWSGVTVSGCFADQALLVDAHFMAWVLMPDHVHWMIQLGENNSLSRVVNRLKSASARRLNQLLDRQGPVWDKAFHDRALRREDDLRAMARYVITNPLRSGLVKRVGDYPFWDAVWL